MNKKSLLIFNSIWRFSGESGERGQKMVFEAYSKQYNHFCFISDEEKWKKNSREGGRRFAELLDLPLLIDEWQIIHETKPVSLDNLSLIVCQIISKDPS